MTDVDLVTRVVVIVKVALVLPPAIATLAGTTTDDELSLNATTTPPLGAGPPNLTVPRDVAPPLTLVGLTESELNATVGKTVIVTVATLLLFVPLFAM